MKPPDYIAFRAASWLIGTEGLNNCEELMLLKVCLPTFNEGRGLHRSLLPELLNRFEAAEIDEALTHLQELKKVRVDGDGYLWNGPAFTAYQEAVDRIRRQSQRSNKRWHPEEHKNGASSGVEEPDEAPKREKEGSTTRRRQQKRTNNGTTQREG